MSVPSTATGFLVQFARMLSTLVLSCLLVVAVSGCDWIVLVSQTSSGDGLDDHSSWPDISANGRFVAFHSTASNVVPGDTNARPDVFVRDTLEGVTTRVSIDSSGNESTGNSLYPSISGDGRYAAFASNATNLVSHDTNNAQDIFHHDLDTGVTTRVSVDSMGNEANHNSFAPALSDDGGHVAFLSFASNLVLGDINNSFDVFVHNLETGITLRVSVDTSGIEANDDSSGRPGISEDGRFVAFASWASNLVAGDTNGRLDIFVHDLESGETHRMSVDSMGNQAQHRSSSPSISADGRYVVFESDATNLVAENSGRYTDIYVHDRHTGMTSMVSVDSSGNEGNFESSRPDISGDGRYITFYSGSSNLVSNDTNDARDVFVHDRVVGATHRASLDFHGGESNDGSVNPTISRDGRYVAFTTSASNLVPNDVNGASDVVLKALPQLTITSVVPHMLPLGATTSITITGTNFLPGTTPGLSGLGKSISNIVIVDENILTADVAVEANAESGARHLSLVLPGTGPGGLSGDWEVCENCVTFF